MKNFGYSKLLAFIIILSFISIDILPGIKGDTAVSNDSLADFTPKLLLPAQNSLFNTSGAFSTENPEGGHPVVVSLTTSEDIEILDNGTADLHIIMDVSSRQLIELYLEAFGIPSNLTKFNLEIPQNASRSWQYYLQGNITNSTLTEPVRERFLKGIVDEQKFLFGFHIINFYNARVVSTDTKTGLQIVIDAYANPYVSYIKETDRGTQYTLESSPKEDLDDFVYAQLDMTRIVILSFPGMQSYNKVWNLHIHLPDGSNAIAVEERQVRQDLGVGSSITTELTRQSSTVVFHQVWTVGEGSFDATAVTLDKLFTVNYMLDGNAKPNFRDVKYNFSHPSFDDYEWQGPDWDFTLPTFSGTFPIEYELTLGFHLGFGGTIHVDLWGLCAWVRADLRAGVTLDGYIQGTIASVTLWDLNDLKITGRNYVWIGGQPLYIEPTIAPSARIEVGVDGRLDFTLHPYAEFWAKGGLDIDWEWWPPHFEFHPIFDYGADHFTFQRSFQVSVEAFIKPAFGAILGLLVMGIIGPQFTFEFYDSIAFGKNLTTQQNYWHAEIGFDILIGIQFLCAKLSWDWPSPLLDIPLWSFDSRDDPGGYDPPDIDPPVTTLYIIPMINGKTGGKSNFWLTVEDPGADASGVAVTRFNLPDYHGYNVYEDFDYNADYFITTNLPYYTLNYYSVDNSQNAENTHSDVINTDLTPPTSEITIGQPSDGQSVVANETPITINAYDESGTQIWYRYWDGDFGWSEWGNADPDTPLVFQFPVACEGVCNLEWISMDGLWNFEDVHQETFYVQSPQAVLNSVIMCDWVNPDGTHGPAKTQFDFDQTCYCYIEMSKNLPGDTITWYWTLNGRTEFYSDTYPSSSVSWAYWTPYIAGDWRVDIYQNDVYLGSGPTFTITGGPGASLWDAFMCEWVNPDGTHGPEKTEFNYQQRCYAYCEFENYVPLQIVKYLWKKDDTVYHLTESLIGMYCWDSWIPFSSGRWSVDILVNGVYVGSGPDFIVREPAVPKGIIMDFTVSPNPVDPGADLIATIVGKNFGEAAGYFMMSLQTSQHGTSWSNPALLQPGQVMTFQETFESISQSMYCNGTVWCSNSKMNDTISTLKSHQRNYVLQDEDRILIELASQEVLGKILFNQSEFLTGPFNPGQTGRTVAWVTVMNNGSDPGVIHVSLYEYPNTPDEKLQYANTASIDPGEAILFQVWVDIKHSPSELWPFGLKVWGATEAEPGWGTPDKTYQWDVHIVVLHDPVVITNDAQHINQTNSVLQANLADDGGESCTVGFWYGTTQPLSDDNCFNVTCLGKFRLGDVCMKYITDLIPGELYYTRSWAKNSVDFVLSQSVVSFYTIPLEPVRPTVMTNASTGIDKHNATLHGFVYDDGSVPCIVGFWYGTTQPLTEGNSINITCPGYYFTNDSFSKSISGLEAGTTYYVCSWALNTAGFFVSNLSSYDTYFGNFSYTFDSANLGRDIPDSHTIVFPLSLWSSNSSIGTNDTVLNFLHKGGVWNAVKSIFYYDSLESQWVSWRRWRYDQGLDNSLLNLVPDAVYYFYLNQSYLPISMNFSYDLGGSVWYQITLPSNIWAHNSSVSVDDSCENFCQQGGIWDDIEWIYHPKTWTDWEKGATNNTLTNLIYNEVYFFKLANRIDLTFQYDQNATLNFETNPDLITNCYSLSTGWNLIVLSIETDWWASDLGANISGCQIVSRFDPVSQTFRSYIVGGPPGFDFPILGGCGYFVRVSCDSVFCVTGYPLANVSVPLYIGWNLIGWYHQYPTMASSLGTAIPGCEVVSWFDPVNQTFRSYLVGGPPGFDFVISCGMGIMVFVTEESIWYGQG